MISLEKYKRLLDSGLLLDHYFLLCNIRDSVPLPKSKRIEGFLNLLRKKGFIEKDNTLQEKAFDVIDIFASVTIKEQVVETPKFDFGGWASELHKKCVDKLIRLTGNKQIIARFNKGDKGYPFLPNLMDFTTRIFSTIQRYKLKDMDSVEKAILAHIDSCHQKNNWFPLMKYYMYKQGEGSNLVTDLENGVEGIQTNNKGLQKFV